jgi:hypothetical protein
MISFRTAQPTRARLAALALLCAAALGLAACGGGDDESSTSSASTTTTTDAQSQFFGKLAQLLTKQGYPPKQADCVVSRLQRSLSDKELGSILSTAQVSGTAKQEIAKAASSCAKTNGE